MESSPIKQPHLLLLPLALVQMAVLRLVMTMLLACVVLLGIVRAAPGDLDPLNPMLAGGIVYATAVQPDGKVIFGGDFTSVLGVPRNYIARINADGTLDMGFNPNANGAVYSIAIQVDGKVLLGGEFGTLQPNGAVSATARNRIARVNADGTLDTGFNPNSNGFVYCVAVQADGKVLLGGEFLTLQPNGAASTTIRNCIARVNADGTLDTGFNPNANDAVFSVAVQADGKVLLCGRFTSLQPNGAASATTRNRVARVNASGTLDTGFNPNANNWVNSVSVQADTKVLLSGSFTTLQPNGAASATTRNRIARVNADGALDTGFNPNANNGVFSVAVQADGKVLLGGEFTTLQPNGADSATTRNRVARVNADGTLDTSFNPNANSGVNSVAVQADGKVLLGGGFTTLQPNGAASPTTRNYIARLINDPATQSLAASSAAQVDWTRGGSAPELSRVNFEMSTNGGTTWSTLGAGFRVGITPNWRLTGLSLPVSGQLRARGITTRGQDNGSSGLIEQVTSYSFGSPEIAISGNGVDIADGDTTPSLTDHTDFGSINTSGSTVTRTFTISNSGSDALNLTGTPKVAISGTHAAEFTVNALPSSPIAALSGTTTFQITFDPSASGPRTATISIANDDADKNPFNFIIRGNGISATEIAASGNGVDIADNDNSPSPVDGTDFGISPLNGTPVSRAFTITNSGSSTLFLNGSPPVALSGSSDFVVTQQPTSTSLPPGGTVNFEVTFYPNDSGPHTMVVSIINSDLDENPFNFTLGGNVDAGPVSFPDPALEAAIRAALGIPSNPLTQGDLLALTSLNLRGLGISNLSGLESATNLRILDLRNNAFTDSAALWEVLDQLSLYCLYINDYRPAGDPPGLLTQDFIDTSGTPFLATVNPAFLPTLSLSSLDINLSVPTNQDSLQAISNSGIVIDNGGGNLAPFARATASVLNRLAGTVGLDGSASADIDGTIVSWSWSWTGGSATGTNPTITLPLGEPSVTLTVTDGLGETGSTTLIVDLTPEVIFTDAALETAIRNALSSPTEPITQASMRALENINLSNLGLTNLSGLEFATNLRILDIRGNAFTSAAATWVILDLLDPYCLYADLARPGGSSPGLTTQSVTNTTGGTFFIIVDALNLPTLNISGLGIDTSNQSNLAALQVFATAGVTVETGGTNLPPIVNASANVLSHLDGTVSLDGSASDDIDGTVVTWLWSWPGGNSTSVNPAITLPVGETVVTLTVTDDDAATSSIQLTVRIFTFASAIQSAGLTGNDALPNAIPFGDGVPNLLKFAFNMNLAGPDSRTLSEGGNSGLPTHRVVSAGAASVFRYEYIRHVNAGLLYTPRKKTDLGSGQWQTLTSAPVITVINDNWVRVVHEEPFDPATTPKCFFSVEVELGQ